MNNLYISSFNKIKLFEKKIEIYLFLFNVKFSLSARFKLVYSLIISLFELISLIIPGWNSTNIFSKIDPTLFSDTFIFSNIFLISIL